MRSKPRKNRANQCKVSHWLFLVLLSLALAVLLRLAHVPGEALLGPMIAGIIIALRFGVMKIRKAYYNSAQILVFCFIASTITPQLIQSFAHDYPIFIAAVFCTLCVSILIGFTMAKLRWLPPAEAMLGCAPGGAAAMIPIAEATSADVRVVLIMQYTRLLLVTATMALTSQIYLGATDLPPVTVGTIRFDSENLATTLAFAAITGLATHYLPFPSFTFLMPLVLGGLLNGLNLVTFDVPVWLLLPSLAVLGWSVGLQFDATFFRHVVVILPKMALASLIMIFLVGLVAATLSVLTNTDPLTTFLATSPGGVDAAVILAAAAHAEVSFVAGLQITRLICVILLSPLLIRLTLKFIDRD